MIPNKRPTMLTDCASFGTDDESLNRLYGIRELPKYVVPADFARTLERSLAERTEERDKWASLAAQYSAEREHNANMALAYKADLDLMTQDRDSETRWAATYVKERDTGLAKLAKCREALDKLHIANETSKPEIYEWYLTDPFASEARDNAIETLEETK